MAKAPEAFRTISEASAELGVPSHVLRFWETRFSFVRPMKRAGGRRFYRRQDIDVLRGVRNLLHEEGYTIKGVQRLHREQGIRRVVAAGGGDPASAVEPPPEDARDADDAAEEAAFDEAFASDPAGDEAWADEGDGEDLIAFAAEDMAAASPEPGAAPAPAPPPTPHRPVLGPEARHRLEEVLGDLEAAKADIDRLLGEGRD